VDARIDDRQAARVDAVDIPFLRKAGLQGLAVV
jgi:hypothetical protein